VRVGRRICKERERTSGREGGGGAEGVRAADEVGDTALILVDLVRCGEESLVSNVGGISSEMVACCVAA
jgi:hypothetical protein